MAKKKKTQSQAQTVNSQFPIFTILPDPNAPIPKFCNEFDYDASAYFKFEEAPNRGCNFCLYSSGIKNLLIAYECNGIDEMIDVWRKFRPNDISVFLDTGDRWGHGYILMVPDTFKYGDPITIDPNTGTITF